MAVQGSVALDPAAASSSPFVAINAGGPAVTTGGVAYSADQHFVGGSTYSTGAAIANTTDDVIYQTERYGQNFSYALPVANGDYSVTLQFAEIYFNAPGQRVFDVYAEGALVINDLDVWSAAGGENVAKDITVPVSVKDGELDLQFVSSVENAKVSGIRVTPMTVPVSVTQSGGSTSVTEGGATDDVSLVLTQQPTANVTIAVKGDADITGAPTSLTFTPTNWNVAQSVTVTAVDDTLVEGPETATLSFAASSADPAFNGVAIPSVAVQVTDNDQSASTTPYFVQSTLSGLPADNYTSLQFGPDGRLYVAKVDGTILALNVQQTSTGYQVAAGGIETINLVKQITNYNDDGTLAAGAYQGTRQVTGILVTSTATSPVVIYVSSSDPRAGGGPGGGDVNLDTNSGVISRLTRHADGSWDRVDLVRGLPRSEENHSVNGMQLSADGHTLFVAVGGNTNEGAPSNNFAYLPEDAYSAAIVSVDLSAIDAMPVKTDPFGASYKYDLPTLPPGPNDPYPNDPFGGQDGLSQAKIVAGGPVQIYSTGYRNPYDLVLTQAGKLYTIDNGANAGWGDVPIGEGTSNVTNAPHDGGGETSDQLHLVTQGFYAGHPNPIRANPSGAGWYLNGSSTPVANLPQGWPPVPTADPVEGDFRAPGQDGALYWGFNASTDGLAEYTASTFGGVMKGNLLAVSWDDQLYRIVLSADGTSVVSVTPLTSGWTVLGSGSPLDVTSPGDGQPFAGSIFVANYGGPITIFTPSATPPPPPPSSLDTDGDGLPDNVDPFAEDPANGSATTLAAGQSLAWTFSQNVDPPGPNGLFNVGFTGLMANGVDSYQSLYDPANIKAGAAGAGFQIDQVSAGDAVQGNSQQNGFQFGIDVQPGVSRIVIETKIDNPFGGSPSTAAVNWKSQGFFIGTGDQDNYLKIVAAANGGAGGIEVGGETAGAFASTMYPAGIVSGIQTLDTITLRLTIDMASGVATPSWTYTVNGSPINGTGSPVQLAGATLSALHGGYAVNGVPSQLAVGIISTSYASGQPFEAFWQSINITAEGTAPPAPGAPTGLDLAAADDTGVSSTDNITFKTSGLTITGSGVNGDTVTLYDDANNNALKDAGEATLATATVVGGVFGADVALAEGAHHVRAYQTDASGQASASSSALDIVVDTTSPAPAVTAMSLAQGPNGRLKLAGTSEPGSVVSVFEGSTKLGQVTAASDGTWSFTSSSRPTDTPHVYTVSAVDVAGNTGAGVNTAVLGSSAGDTLSGGGGADRILGGGGGDSLTGGQGGDVFIYAQTTESRPGTPDTIGDFLHGQDLFDFTGIKGLHSAAIVFGSQAPAAIPGRTIEVITTGSETTVYANASASSESLASVDMVIHLPGATGLTGSDFLL